MGGNVKIQFKWDGESWIGFVRLRKGTSGRHVVQRVIDFRAPQNARNVLSRWRTISFSRRIPLPAIGAIAANVRIRRCQWLGDNRCGLAATLPACGWNTCAWVTGVTQSYTPAIVKKIHQRPTNRPQLSWPRMSLTSHLLVLLHECTFQGSLLSLRLTASSVVVPWTLSQGCVLPVVQPQESVLTTRSNSHSKCRSGHLVSLFKRFVRRNGVPKINKSCVFDAGSFIIEWKFIVVIQALRVTS